MVEGPEARQGLETTQARVGVATDSAIRVWQWIARRARDAGPLLPRVVRKPAVLLEWLVSARRAQVVTAVLFLTLWLVLPQALGATLERLYPPIETEKKLLGLIKVPVKRPDPHLEIRQRQVTAVAWIGAVGVVVLLLAGELPQAVARATEAARLRERQADASRSIDPERSLGLYRSALRLTSDSSSEARLTQKVAHLRRQGALALGNTIRKPGQAPVPEHDRDLGCVGPGGRYRLEVELGQGGMGIVYRATDAILRRPVAVKGLPIELLVDESLADRFRQEAHALARLAHPHIVQVHDFLEDAGRLWMVMEFVGGGDLAQLIDEHGRLPVARASEVALAVCEALDCAHRSGVIHRDIKPMNVLLTLEGVPKLTDFGIARLAESTARTRVGSLLGSPCYMSPEQASGIRGDERSDIYALGITIYEMLTGRTPFEGDTSSVLAQHITQPPSAPSRIVNGIPDELEAMVLAMLAKQPGERPQTMSIIAERLRPFSSVEG